MNRFTLSLRGATVHGRSQKTNRHPQKAKEGCQNLHQNPDVEPSDRSCEQTRLGDITKKHTVAFLEELNELVFLYAPVGSKIPGLGKLLLREVPARAARTVVIGGVERQIPRKPKSKKLVFRIEKAAKDRFIK